MDSDSARAWSWLSHWPVPRVWSVMIHDTTASIDAIACALMRPARPHGPPGGCLTRPAGTASQEGWHGRRPAGLRRWRARADHPPAPHAPAWRLRPRSAARGPGSLLRQDSRRPPGAAGRAREGAPKTRRAGTPSRPHPQGSLGGSCPPRVWHSRPAQFIGDCSSPNTSIVS